ncbi:MAG TPA: metallophosphoesterase, partial [Vicinamibacteria bacterium]|nr:metallophosphoesterase [Vicinamibacteria bacterium]
DHALVARAAAAEGARLALHTGDMVVNAADDQLWDRWFSEEADLLLRTPFVPTVGNHEITDNGVSYSRYFKDPSRPAYHSLDYGPVHLVVLDSFETAAGADAHVGAVSDAQMAWVEEDLRGVPADTHVWVLVHQGPFAHPARMRPGHGGSERVRLAIQAAARRHPIEAVFAGHEHFYERGEVDGLRYFVVGGGGAPLEDPDPTFPTVQAAHKALSFVTLDVCGCHVTGKAKDIAGRVLDSFTLSSCKMPCGAPLAAKGGP